MSNTKLFLLIGTSLSLIPTLSFAQCVATQDCTTLGYTETSCNGGKGVKCPFGNKWACLATASDFEQQFCTTYGFKYACSGTGYSGGAGKACNGKYVSCNCASGYKWNGTSCVKESCSSAYQYTCSGTGYAGGAGTACGGKYAYCKCSGGYIWKNGSCIKPTCLNSQTIEATWAGSPQLKECIEKQGSYQAVCIYYTNGCGTVELQGSRSFSTRSDCMQKWENACYPLWDLNPGLRCDICTKYDI